MSRVGRKPIELPEGVKVEISGKNIKIIGPNGEQFVVLTGAISVKTVENTIVLEKGDTEKQTGALFGLYRALIANAVVGVSSGYKKELEINGVGFRASMDGNTIVMSLGFSHPIRYTAPDGIELKVTKNIISVSGIDKQLVGKVAAEIREFKKPEPYKGKGIKYTDEHIRRKAGKSGKAGA